jgi:hypothetical protein
VEFINRERELAFLEDAWLRPAAGDRTCLGPVVVEWVASARRVPIRNLPHCASESWNTDPALLETAVRQRADQGRRPTAVVLPHCP